MKTIEEIYAEMFEEHENVMAARRQERIKASNPYGCNQYGHRKGHGGSSSGGSSNQREPEKKGDNKPEEKKPQQAPKKQPEKTRITREVAEFDKMAEAAYSTLEEKRKKIANSSDSKIGKGIKLDEVERKAKYVKNQLEALQRAKAQYEEALDIKSNPNFDPELEPEGSIGYNIDNELEKRKRHYETMKRDLSKAIDEYNKL